MPEIRRQITVTLVDDVECERMGVEVMVPEGMTTMEAVGLLEIAKIQHLQSKCEQGPTVYQSPDGAS
jgi:hypothetical protein